MSGVHYPGGVIDLRLHQARERLMLIEQTLSRLGIDEDVLLVFHEPPARLPAHIHTQFPGRFELIDVDQGPGVWSVRVHPVAS